MREAILGDKKRVTFHVKIDANFGSIFRSFLGSIFRSFLGSFLGSFFRSFFMAFLGNSIEAVFIDFYDFITFLYFSIKVCKSLFYLKMGKIIKM